MIRLIENKDRTVTLQIGLPPLWTIPVVIGAWMVWTLV